MLEQGQSVGAGQPKVAQRLGEEGSVIDEMALQQMARPGTDNPEREAHGALIVIGRVVHPYHIHSPLYRP